MKFLPLLLMLPFTGSAFAGDCAVSYERAVISGPLSDSELTAKMRCEIKLSVSKKEQQTFYVCAISGTPKRKFYEQYGKGEMLIISAEESASEKAMSGLIGEWFSYRGPQRQKNNGLEDVLVTGTDLGTKVLRKSSKDDNSSMFILEKINLSLVEKTLRYEKGMKTKKALVAQEEKSLDCVAFEGGHARAEGTDEDGLPIRKGISSRAKKPVPYAKPAGGK